MAQQPVVIQQKLPSRKQVELQLPEPIVQPAARPVEVYGRPPDPGVPKTNSLLQMEEALAPLSQALRSRYVRGKQQFAEEVETWSQDFIKMRSDEEFTALGGFLDKEQLQAAAIEAGVPESIALDPRFYLLSKSVAGHRLGSVARDEIPVGLTRPDPDDPESFVDLTDPNIEIDLDAHFRGHQLDLIEELNPEGDVYLGRGISGNLDPYYTKMKKTVVEQREARRIQEFSTNLSNLYADDLAGAMLRMDEVIRGDLKLEQQQALLSTSDFAFYAENQLATGKEDAGTNQLRKAGFESYVASEIAAGTDVDGIMEIFQAAQVQLGKAVFNKEGKFVRREPLAAPGTENFKWLQSRRATALTETNARDNESDATYDRKHARGTQQAAIHVSNLLENELKEGPITDEHKQDITDFFTRLGLPGSDAADSLAALNRRYDEDPSSPDALAQVAAWRNGTSELGLPPRQFIDFVETARLNGMLSKADAQSATDMANERLEAGLEQYNDFFDGVAKGLPRLADWDDYDHKDKIFLLQKLDALTLRLNADRTAGLVNIHESLPDAKRLWDLTGGGGPVYEHFLGDPEVVAVLKNKVSLRQAAFIKAGEIDIQRRSVNKDLDEMYDDLGIESLPQIVEESWRNHYLVDYQDPNMQAVLRTEWLDTPEKKQRAFHDLMHGISYHGEDENGNPRVIEGSRPFYQGQFLTAMKALGDRQAYAEGIAKEFAGKRPGEDPLTGEADTFGAKVFDVPWYGLAFRTSNEPGDDLGLVTKAAEERGKLLRQTGGNHKTLAETEAKLDERRPEMTRNLEDLVWALGHGVMDLSSEEDRAVLGAVGQDFYGRQHAAVEGMGFTSKRRKFANLNGKIVYELRTNREVLRTSMGRPYGGEGSKGTMSEYTGKAMSIDEATAMAIGYTESLGTLAEGVLDTGEIPEFFGKDTPAPNQFRYFRDGAHFGEWQKEYRDADDADRPNTRLGKLVEILKFDIVIPDPLKPGEVVPMAEVFERLQEPLYTLKVAD